MTFSPNPPTVAKLESCGVIVDGGSLVDIGADDSIDGVVVVVVMVVVVGSVDGEDIIDPDRLACNLSVLSRANSSWISEDVCGGFYIFWTHGLF